MRFLYIAHVLIILILNMNFVTVFGFCRIFLFARLHVARTSNLKRAWIEESTDRREEQWQSHIFMFMHVSGMNECAQCACVPYANKCEICRSHEIESVESKSN